MLLLFVAGDVLGAGIYALVGVVGGGVGGAMWTAFVDVNKAWSRPFVAFLVASRSSARG